jgi:hypothetical protein
MAEIKLFRKIDCPDFGEIKINTFIPHAKLAAFVEPQIDVSKHYNDLIKTIINTDIVEISQLTEKDLECITLELARTYDVDKIYITLRNSAPRPEAFQGALKKRPKLKKIEDSFALINKSLIDGIKESMITYEKIFEPIRLYESSLIKMTGSQYLLKEISKSMKFQNQFRDIAKELSIVKPIDEYLLKNLFDIKKAFAASLPSLSLSQAVERSVKEIFDQYSIRTKAIAEAIKSTSAFRDNLKLVAESFNEISKNRDFLSNQLKLANETIYSSEKIVYKANDYFSTWRKIPEIPRKAIFPDGLVEMKAELEDNNIKSEQILEIEAGTSILTSNGIVYSLWGEVKELREDIKKLAGLKSLNQRLQMLEDPKLFIECLKTFADETGKDDWQIFWRTNGVKFVPNPERFAKSHLGIFLKGKFSGAAFVGREIRSGNGFIDVYVHFFGKVYIIEMKMVGSSWSISEAEDGIKQLDKYMYSENQNESYLVVFDGRKTDKGNQLNEYYDLDHGRVWVVASKIYWKRAS